MALDIKVFIAIDDNTPVGHAPFLNDPGVWSLEEDVALTWCGDSMFFAALGYDGSQQDSETSKPLFPLRGKPTFLPENSPARRWIELEDYVGWLDGTELFAALRHQSIVEDDLTRPVRVLLGVVRYLCSVYGDERIRIVFVFIP